MHARARLIAFAASLAVAGVAGLGMLVGASAQPSDRHAAPAPVPSTAPVGHRLHAGGGSRPALAGVSAAVIAQRRYAMPFYSFAGRLAAAGRG